MFEQYFEFRASFFDWRDLVVLQIEEFEVIIAKCFAVLGELLSFFCFTLIVEGFFLNLLLHHSFEIDQLEDDYWFELNK